MARMKGAEWKPISVNHTDGGMGAIHGVCLHIMDGSFEGTDAWFRNPAAQASSHFGTARTGKLRQWLDTGDKSWAQAGGNPNWISIENEGRGGDALTDAQLNACASVLAWAAHAYGFPLKVTSDPHGAGLGHHAMGGSAWGGHTLCPGSRIVAQKPEIVRRAKLIINGGGNPSAPTWMEKLMKDLPLVGPGDDSFDVKTVRANLFARGRVPASAYKDGEKGLEGWLESTKCDPQLVGLIRSFQVSEDLDDDGYVGPLTWPPLLRVA